MAGWMRLMFMIFSLFTCNSGAKYPEYVGCYSNWGMYSGPVNHPLECITRCLSLTQYNYRYAGVRIGYYCYCGEILPSSQDSRCVACYNSQYMCGNHYDTRALYKADITDPRYIGCYIYNEGYTFETNHLWENLSSDMKTIDNCINSCIKINKLYARLVNGKECYCGNIYEYSGQGSGCNVTCQGNSSQICGGTYWTSVYKAECPLGFWGSENPVCSNPCGHCQNGDQCDLHTGYCNGICAPGWTGQQKCDRMCESGNFGEGCSSQCYCENNVPCHHVTGACPGGRCASGYEGPTCSHDTCSEAFEVNFDRNIGYSSQCKELEVKQENKTNCMRRACELKANVINFDDKLCSIRRCEEDLQLSTKALGWDVLVEVGCSSCRPSPEESTQNQEATNPLPIYAIVLICVGTLALIITLTVIIACWLKRKPHKEQAVENKAPVSEAKSQDNPDDVYEEITEPAGGDVKETVNQTTESDPYDDDIVVETHESKSYETLNMEDVAPPVPSVYSSMTH